MKMDEVNVGGLGVGVTVDIQRTDGEWGKAGKWRCFPCVVVAVRKGSSAARGTLGQVRVGIILFWFIFGYLFIIIIFSLRLSCGQVGFDSFRICILLRSLPMSSYCTILFYKLGFIFGYILFVLVQLWIGQLCFSTTITSFGVLFYPFFVILMVTYNYRFHIFYHDIRLA